MKTTRQAQVTFVTLLVLFLSLLIGDGFAERGPVAAKLDANEYAGLGRMFGFKFLENFNYPYVANSITGFWRRWHMSLSSWFRDYLYIPLGGNRGSAAKTYRNLFIVFLLCGLWHGASWNFVIWGLFHGGLLVAERLAHRKLPGFLRPLGHVYALLAVLVGWVFFRAETLEQSLQFLNLMFLGWGSWTHWGCVVYLDNWTLMILLLGVVGAFPVIPTLTKWCDTKSSLGYWQQQGASVMRAVGWCALYSSFLLTLALLCAGTYSSFIYFRF
jgi:alginate O-acetyltransferase complex protein AlgI